MCVYVTLTIIIIIPICLPTYLPIYRQGLLTLHDKFLALVNRQFEASSIFHKALKVRPLSTYIHTYLPTYLHTYSELSNQ